MITFDMLKYMAQITDPWMPMCGTKDFQPAKIEYVSLLQRHHDIQETFDSWLNNALYYKHTIKLIFF